MQHNTITHTQMILEELKNVNECLELIFILNVVF